MPRILLNAAGLGIRAVARGFEVAPKTVRHCLVAAADHLQGFSQDFLHDVWDTQVPLDARYALLRAVQDGEGSEAETLHRLARSPQGVWVALDLLTKRLLTRDGGDRTLAMAQGGGIRWSRYWPRTVGRCC